ncbi:hypothetical protein BGZ70_002534 [Mortierella alpina]|uniref:Uncharacterized protein n=1 Tax=Mortierella alpina TaxID=64518 RepID=A0A9P6M5F7_MORAP|nr:hypothetical protein BGZ70_002534 [Mortierella alpina]
MPHLTSLEQELAEEERTLRAEQEWFLATQVKPGLENIQNALTACQEAARLQDDAKGALTLAISSTNNDTLKGFVTLAGSFIVKGDLTIKLPKLPVVKATIHSNIPSTVSTPAASSLLATAATSLSNAGSSTVASSTSSVTGVPSTTDGAEAESSLRGAETEGSSGDGSQDDRQKPFQDTQQEPSQPLQQVALGNPQNAHQSLSTYRPPGHLTQPYFLEQLKDVQNHTAEAIYKLEDYWQHLVRLGEHKDTSAERASKHQERDPATTSEITESIGTLKTLLQLMQRHLRAGIQAMAQPAKEKLYPFKVCDPKIFSPALSEDFVIEFYIRDSQLVCAAYALQLTGGNNTSNSGGGSSGGALVSYLQQALPGASTPTLAPAPSMPIATSSSVRQSAEGFIPHSSPQPPPTVYSGSGTGVSGALLSASNAASSSVGGGGGGSGAKSGHVTPHATSPSVLQQQHHHTAAAPPIHQRQLSSGQVQQLSQAGAKAPSSSFPWSPSRTMSVTDVHANVSAGPPSNESVVLPPSNKIGQTSKGGIK